MDYIHLPSGKREYGILGTPQGGVLSPILSNIYLHSFDTYMEREMDKANNDPIPVSIDNPEYKSLHIKISNRRATLKKAQDKKTQNNLLGEITKLEKARHRHPSKTRNPNTYRV